MAWTEQCKIAFKSNADFLYQTQEGRKSVNKILKKLSKESDIPCSTLWNWWREEEEKKFAENGKDGEQPEIVDETMDDRGAGGAEPVCLECQKNSVYTHKGKPLGPTSKYYGLCGSCRYKKQKSSGVNCNVKTNQRYIYTCPHCSEVLYIYSTDLKKEETNE